MWLQKSATWEQLRQLSIALGACARAGARQEQAPAPRRAREQPGARAWGRGAQKKRGRNLESCIGTGARRKELERATCIVKLVWRGQPRGVGSEGARFGQRLPGSAVLSHQQCVAISAMSQRR